MTLQESIKLYQETSKRLGLATKTPNENKEISIYIESLYPTIISGFQFGEWSTYINALQKEYEKLASPGTFIWDTRRINHSDIERNKVQYKIAINSVYGLISNPNSPYYDEKLFLLIGKYRKRLLKVMVDKIESLGCILISTNDVDTVFLRTQGLSIDYILSSVQLAVNDEAKLGTPTFTKTFAVKLGGSNTGSNCFCDRYL